MLKVVDSNRGTEFWSRVRPAATLVTQPSVPPGEAATAAKPAAASVHRTTQVAACHSSGTWGAPWRLRSDPPQYLSALR